MELSSLARPLAERLSHRDMDASSATSWKSAHRLVDARAHTDAHARARTLVLAHGWNTTCYQILNPGFELWFSNEHPAVIGYVRGHGYRVVAGAPVCIAEHLAAVVAEFSADAKRANDRVLYFGAEARLEQLVRASPRHSRVLLGAQPVWNPETWETTISTHASQRAQLARARNKGVRVETWPNTIAERHPALERCLADWLSMRPLPPLHFLIEPDTLGVLADRHVIVATQNDIPVGFLVASPIPARHGWLIEQFVRTRNAPNGTAELMIDAAMRWMARSGFRYATLGLAPLSRHVPSMADAPPHPWWLRVTFDWLRAHARRFYNFDGLDAFKAKFDPVAWEPVFAVTEEDQFSIASLMAIAAAFTNGKPLRTIARGLANAAQQEMRWVLHRPRAT
jgi:phosphatidylglycerol lysyltransferase